MSKPGSLQDQLDGMDALWRDARDKIAALEAENARLRAALAANPEAAPQTEGEAP